MFLFDRKRPQLGRRRWEMKLANLLNHETALIDRRVLKASTNWKPRLTAHQSVPSSGTWVVWDKLRAATAVMSLDRLISDFLNNIPIEAGRRLSLEHPLRQDYEAPTKNSFRIVNFTTCVFHQIFLSEVPQQPCLSNTTPANGGSIKESWLRFQAATPFFMNSSRTPCTCHAWDRNPKP